MAHTKSAEKRMRQNAKRNLYNRSVRSTTKTWIKRLEKGVREKAADVSEILRACVSEIDKAAAKGVLHRNTAARRKARAYRLANAATVKK